MVRILRAAAWVEEGTEWVGGEREGRAEGSGGGPRRVHQEVRGGGERQFAWGVGGGTRSASSTANNNTRFVAQPPRGLERRGALRPRQHPQGERRAA